MKVLIKMEMELEIPLKNLNFLMLDKMWNVKIQMGNFFKGSPKKPHRKFLGQIGPFIETPKPLKNKNPLRGRNPYKGGNFLQGEYLKQGRKSFSSKSL